MKTWRMSRSSIQLKTQSTLHFHNIVSWAAWTICCGLGWATQQCIDWYHDGHTNRRWQAWNSRQQLSAGISLHRTAALLPRSHLIYTCKKKTQNVYVTYKAMYWFFLALCRGLWIATRSIRIKEKKFNFIFYILPPQRTMMRKSRDRLKSCGKGAAYFGLDTRACTLEHAYKLTRHTPSSIMIQTRTHKNTHTHTSTHIWIYQHVCICIHNQCVYAYHASRERNCSHDIIV